MKGLMNWSEAMAMVKKWNSMKNRAAKLNDLYFKNVGIEGREELASKYIKNMYKQKNKNITFMKLHKLGAYC